MTYISDYYAIFETMSCLYSPFKLFQPICQLKWSSGVVVKWGERISKSAKVSKKIWLSMHFYKQTQCEPSQVDGSREQWAKGCRAADISESFQWEINCYIICVSTTESEPQICCHCQPQQNVLGYHVCSPTTITTTESVAPQPKLTEFMQWYTLGATLLGPPIYVD